MPVGVVHIAPVRIGQFKLHPGQRLMGFGVQFPDDEGALLAVVKPEGLYLTGLDFNRLRGAVQDVALQRFDLPGGDSGTGLQIVDHDAASLVSDIFAVGWTDHRAGAVGHQEGNALQRRSSAFDVLLNDEGRRGGIGKVERLCVVGIDLDGLRLMGRVDGVAGDGLHLRHHQGTHHPVDLDLAVLVRLVEAIT